MRIVLPTVVNNYYNVDPSGNGTSMNYAQTKLNSPPSIAANASFPAEVISCTITTHGGPVQIFAYGDAVNASQSVNGVLNLYRDNNPVGHRTWFEGNGANENQEFALSVIDDPAAGTYTYSLKLCSMGANTITFGEAQGPVIYAVELQNIIGPKGDTGATGPSGLQGVQGSQGPGGANGVQGAQGTQGVQGAAGTGITFVSVPASATAVGSVGQMAQNASHLYICYAPNSWLRTNIDKNF